ncbi:LysR family transcriptional regulator, partial [Burkholderia contaminans]|uniref:LysR family transcriptional regulator n=1 Tax=Burkholderia contaminans TaxID=488447 RepID=UPI002D7F11C9
MDTLQNMRVFVRVVDAGSFTAAAQQMNSTTAYASRAVSDLEAHLRTRLLNRTTRRIALTEAGERYLQRCEQILAYVDQAEAEAGDAHARPSGKLKVHCFTSLGQHYGNTDQFGLAVIADEAKGVVERSSRNGPTTMQRQIGFAEAESA